MNKYEKELFEMTKQFFKNEINKKSIEVNILTPQIAKKEGYPFKGYDIEIRKIREKQRDVRVVIESPDKDIMSEASDYRNIFRTIVEQAKHILDDPPYEKFLTQGILRATDNGAEFISKDILRKEKAF